MKFFENIDFSRRVFIGVLSITGALIIPIGASAQTTPTELAGFSLEDLLNIDLAEGSDQKSTSRWEIGYSYYKGNFGGYKNGSTDLTFDDVLFSPGEIRTSKNYPVVPTFISQEVHGLSVAYEISDNNSIRVTVPYVSQATEHISSVPGFKEFVLKTDGVGDIAVNYLHTKKLDSTSSLQASAGLRIPTGSINEVGDTPRNGSGTDERLPYTMQLGSGTLDFSVAATYSKNLNHVSFGANANTVIRTGTNDNGYRIGNSVSTSVFSKYARWAHFQPGVRLTYRKIQPIHGQDTSLQVPSAFKYPASITDSSNYGGDSATLSVNAKICPSYNCNTSFSVEFSEPVYQNLNGIQPKVRGNFSAGASIKF